MFLKAQCYPKQLSLFLPTDYGGLPVPPGRFMACSENMSYLLGPLDWQDLLEVVRSGSGKMVWARALCRAKEVLKGKP